MHDHCVTLAYVDEDGNVEELYHTHVIALMADIAVAEAVASAAEHNINLDRCNAAQVSVALVVPENAIQMYNTIRREKHGNNPIVAPASMSTHVH